MSMPNNQRGYCFNLVALFTNPRWDLQNQVEDNVNRASLCPLSLSQVFSPYATLWRGKGTMKARVTTLIMTALITSTAKGNVDELTTIPVGRTDYQIWHGEQILFTIGTRVLGPGWENAEFTQYAYTEDKRRIFKDVAKFSGGQRRGAKAPKSIAFDFRYEVEPSIAEKWVDKFTKYGINFVRTHRWTGHNVWDGLMRPDDPLEFDEPRVRLFDYFHAALKRRGIYVGWSPIFALRADKSMTRYIPNIPEILAAIPKRSGLFANSLYSLQCLAIDVQDFHIALTVKWLNRTNSFTGLRYADDPTLVYVWSCTIKPTCL